MSTHPWAIYTNKRLMVLQPNHLLQTVELIVGMIVKIRISRIRNDQYQTKQYTRLTYTALKVSCMHYGTRQLYAMSFGKSKAGLLVVSATLMLAYSNIIDNLQNGSPDPSIKVGL